MAGYSKRSLVEKLGIRKGFRVAIVNPPPDYNATLGMLPKGVVIANSGGPRRPRDGAASPPLLDLVHFFSKGRRELEEQIPLLKRAMSAKGMLWVSWPKGASGVQTDLNENIVREIALKNGLVDVKVCAVDDTWSGLKLVYRLKDRP